MPHDMVNKIEIYTFGSAANHFNNPPRHDQSSMGNRRNPNAVRHIEHYADDGEFVARWGVLKFARMRNRYMGRVFIRPGTGHLLNQHYLNAMFPLDDHKRVKEQNKFMDMQVMFSSDGAEHRARDGFVETLLNNGNGASGAIVEDLQAGVIPLSVRAGDSFASRAEPLKPKVRDFSRLWSYRNGGSPED